MEFKQMYKLLMVAIIAISSFCTLSAKTDVSNNIIYNLQEKDGVLVGQTLYKQEGKTLTQYLRYSYIYNSENRIVENNIEKWDNEAGNWVNGLVTKYSYDGQDVITKTYKWNSSKKEYQLMPEKTNYFKDFSL